MHTPCSVHIVFLCEGGGGEEGGGSGASRSVINEGEVEVAVELVNGLERRFLEEIRRGKMVVTPFKQQENLLNSRSNQTLALRRPLALMLAPSTGFKENNSLSLFFPQSGQQPLNRLSRVSASWTTSDA